MVKKIISGGQTGADQGGLDFALDHGISAGGLCPKGRICENGIIPDKYPLEEVAEDDYHLRTMMNVQDSDGTLIIIRNGYLEEGTQRTMEYCIELSKPRFMVDLVVMSGQMDSVIEALTNWIVDQRITTLNVAGNRESNSPGIQQETFALLEKVFSALSGNKQAER